MHTCLYVCPSLYLCMPFHLSTCLLSQKRPWRLNHPCLCFASIGLSVHRVLRNACNLADIRYNLLEDELVVAEATTGRGRSVGVACEHTLTSFASLFRVVICQRIAFSSKLNLTSSVGRRPPCATCNVRLAISILYHNSYIKGIIYHAKGRFGRRTRPRAHIRIVLREMTPEEQWKVLSPSRRAELGLVDPANAPPPPPPAAPLQIGAGDQFDGDGGNVPPPPPPPTAASP